MCANKEIGDLTRKQRTLPGVGKSLTLDGAIEVGDGGGGWSSTSERSRLASGEMVSAYPYPVLSRDHFPHLQPGSCRPQLYVVASLAAHVQACPNL